MLALLLFQIFISGDLPSKKENQKTGFIEYEKILDADSLGLYRSPFLSIYQMESHFFIISTEGNAVFKTSNDGKVLASYHGKEGQGPGDFGKSKGLLPYLGGVAFYNDSNSQLVCLDENLNYIKNERVDFSFGEALATGNGFWFRQKGGNKLISFYDQSLLKKGEWFEWVGGSDFRERWFAMLLHGGVIYGQSYFFTDSENKVKWFPFEKSGKISNDPAWEAHIAPIPEEYAGPGKSGDFSVRNVVGWIGCVGKFQNWVLVNSVHQTTEDDRVDILDLLNAKDGSFAGRHVSDFQMIKSIGPDIFLFHDEKIVRIVGINP